MDKYQNIKQIYIGNVLEAFHKSYSIDKLQKKEGDFWRRYDALENNRSLLYGGDNKVVITPEKIDSSHLSYICNLADWKNVYNLIPERQSDCVSTDIISDKDFYRKLGEVVRNNPGVEIIQYRHTPEFYLLVERLRKDGLNPVFPELVEKDNRFVEEYFHSKRGFRHLWEQVKDTSLKITIPDGFIAGNKEEAIEAAWWFAKHKRNFAFKYNRGVQGIGVILNPWEQFPEKYDEFVKHAEGMLTDGIWEEPCIVVEEFIEPNPSVLGGSPNVEMRIEKNGQVQREYACAQVIDPDGKTFLGVTMNPEVEENDHMQQAFGAAELYGKRLSSLEYRGIFDMDLVVSTTNKLFAVEANMRRTGGTHAHEFCKTLLGNDYAKRFWVHLQDMSVTENKKFMNLLDKYKYDKKAQSGIIPVNPDMMGVGKAPILIIAPDRKKLNEILEEINEE